MYYDNWNGLDNENWTIISPLVNEKGDIISDKKSIKWDYRTQFGVNNNTILANSKTDLRSGNKFPL